MAGGHAPCVKYSLLLNFLVIFYLPIIIIIEIILAENYCLSSTNRLSVIQMCTLRIVNEVKSSESLDSTKERANGYSTMNGRSPLKRGFLLKFFLVNC